MLSVFINKFAFENNSLEMYMTLKIIIYFVFCSNMKLKQVEVIVGCHSTFTYRMNDTYISKRPMNQKTTYCYQESNSYQFKYISHIILKDA